MGSVSQRNKRKPCCVAYPRYLLRLPYGNKRNPVDTFDFEECSIIPQPEELLWGHPAFLCSWGIPNFDYRRCSRRAG
ncbi:MAG: type VI secretion system contractile sheath large subunit [Methylomicrobium sp.]|nr:type VI secretion system contractile sheath large subunit [Methylomicrobium sp.]